MHPFPIDMYAYQNRLRDAHPAEKMLFAGLTILICLIASSPLVALLALGIVTVAVVRVAGIPLRAFSYFVRLPAGFILIGVLTLAITSVDPANPATLLALPIGPWHVGVMESSLARAVQVASVSFSCVASMLALALAWADHVIVMHRGHLLAEGPPDVVLADDPLLREAGLLQPIVVDAYRQFCAAGLLPSSEAVPRTVSDLTALLVRHAAPRRTPTDSPPD